MDRTGILYDVFDNTDNTDDDIVTDVDEHIYGLVLEAPLQVDDGILNINLNWWSWYHLRKAGREISDININIKKTFRILIWDKCQCHICHDHE